ncbi:MAG: lyase [Planctomycetes bacterium]|nr:lyase [Planctomycetota bacterium]
MMMKVLAVVLALAGNGPVPALPTPPADKVSAAAEEAWTYMYTHDRSAHTNGADICGRTFLLAVASWTGDTTGDARLLKQIRHNLQGDTCLVAAGGYGSQHERIFTGSCVLIRHTPRLWNQLTEDEKHRMDLLMKAALVASAYTTSDAGAAEGRANGDLMGGRNLHRDWNPNFREGMIGMMIVGTIWLGGADNAYAFLDRYDHAAFTQQLKEAGLTNTHRTFAAALEGGQAPKPEQIERDIRNYTYYDTRLDDLMTLYWKLTERTYGATVSAGLNGGAGVEGAGRIAAGADRLPNVGKVGMLYEFASMDAGGPRSSIDYAYTGFRPNLINQVVMLATGYWQRGEKADACIARLKIGIPDLYYKMEHGYLDYSKGHASRRPSTMSGWDTDLMYSLWTDVVEPFHDGKVTCANAGADRTVAAGTAVTLEASASTAAPGTTIRAWRWRAADGRPLAESASATVTLPAGTHPIVLEVTDSAGRVSRDTVVITAK